MADVDPSGASTPPVSVEVIDRSFYYTPTEVCAFSAEEVAKIWTEQYIEHAKWVTVDKSGNVVEEETADQNIKDLPAEERLDLVPVIEKEGAEYDKQLEEMFEYIALHLAVDNSKTDKSDLDGEAALYILRLAGLVPEQWSGSAPKGTPRPVIYVNKGQYVEGRTNIDTGGQTGVGEFPPEKMGKPIGGLKDRKTFFIDHHGEAFNDDLSAAKLVYEKVLKSPKYKQKLLEASRCSEEILGRFIEIVTRSDNMNFDITPKMFAESSRTIYGLSKWARPEQLLRFCADGRDPYELLSDEDLNNYKFIYERDKRENGAVVRRPDGKPERETVNRSEERAKFNDQALSYYEKIKDSALGYIFNSPKKEFGKVMIDIGNHMPVAGNQLARAEGINTFVIWNPMTQSFFISVRGGFPAEFKPEQGINIRGQMWFSPSYKEPLKITLRKLLDEMGVQPIGELAEWAEEKIPTDFGRNFEGKFTKLGTISGSYGEFYKRLRSYADKYNENEESINIDSIVVRHGNWVFCFSGFERPDPHGPQYPTFRSVDPETGKLTKDKFSWTPEHLQKLDFDWYLMKGISMGTASPVEPPVVETPVETPVETTPPSEETPQVEETPVVPEEMPVPTLPEELEETKNDEVVTAQPPVVVEQPAVQETEESPTAVDQPLTVPSPAVDETLFKAPDQPTSDSPIIQEPGLTTDKELKELVETVNGYKILLPEKKAYIDFGVGTKWRLPDGIGESAKVHDVKITGITPQFQKDAEPKLDSVVEVEMIVYYTDKDGNPKTFVPQFPANNIEYWRDLFSKAVDLNDHLILIGEK